MKSYKAESGELAILVISDDHLFALQKFIEAAIEKIEQEPLQLGRIIEVKRVDIKNSNEKWYFTTDDCLKEVTE